jgi:hypothetical protein
MSVEQLESAIKATNPDSLESFEEKDLEQMLRDVATKKNTGSSSLMSNLLTIGTKRSNLVWVGIFLKILNVLIGASANSRSFIPCAFPMSVV